MSEDEPDELDIRGDASLRLLICNTPPDRAEAIARALLEARLAAGVNILPGVISLYWWKGELCQSAESTLLIRTTREREAAATQKILALHPYEVPEVSSLALLPGEGNEAFSNWIRAWVK